MANRDMDLKWLRGLDETYLDCRALRHQWDKVALGVVPTNEVAIRVAPGAQVISRSLRCRRCQCGRIDYYVRENQRNLNGFRRHSSRYLYPNDYTFKGKEHELPAPQFGDFVMETFRRARVNI